MMETLNNSPHVLKTPYSLEELSYFRQLILNKRRDAEEEIVRLQNTINEQRLADEADNSSNAHHIGDMGSEEQELNLNYMLLQRTKAYVNQLNRALVRIENGTYGICRATGNRIPKGRLEIVPHTRYGIEAKKMGLDKRMN